MGGDIGEIYKYINHYAVLTKASVVVCCDGSTVDNRLTFGVERAVWTLAAKMDDGAPWQGRRGGPPTTCDQTRLS